MICVYDVDITLVITYACIGLADHMLKRHQLRVLGGLFMNNYISRMIYIGLADHMLKRHQLRILGGRFAAEAANLRRYPMEMYSAMSAQMDHANEV